MQSCGLNPFSFQICLGISFSSYCLSLQASFCVRQNELTAHFVRYSLKKGRKKIQILSGSGVLNMLYMPTRCTAQHAGLMGQHVKNDVSFFVIHQYFHSRLEKSILSKQVPEVLF